LKSIVGQQGEGGKGLTEDIGTQFIIKKGLLEAIGDVGLELKAWIIAQRLLYLEAIIVHSLVLLDLDYFKFLVVSYCGGPLEISNRSYVLDLLDMVDEEVELGDFVALMMQFHVVSDLAGHFLDYLEKVLLHAIEGVLGHEAQLHLLRKINVPD
jgi:hypothetical protein